MQHLHTPFPNDDHATLIEIMERGLSVRSRQQFFTWDQGIMQNLIPHEILICCINNPIHGDWHKYYHSASRYFKDEHFSLLCAPSGLLPRLISKWAESGQPGIIADHDRSPHRATQFGKDWLPKLQELELKNAVVHGLRGPEGELKAFLCFSRIHGALDNKLAHAVQLLSPYVLDVLCRVLAAEGQGASSRISISRREQEILQWVSEGKTNSEIAQILSLSPFTVKNHVQHIRGKLGVRTRGQAVVRAISIGALKAGGQ
jgi:transcriptional regulator EpsA